MGSEEIEKRDDRLREMNESELGRDLEYRPTDVKSVEKKVLFFPGFGIILVLIAAMFSATNALFAKKINLHAMQITQSRLYMHFLIVLPILFNKRNSVDILGPEGLRLALWLRGITGSTSLIFMYMAVNVLSVGNAIAVAYLSIVMVPFFARIILHESLTVFDIIFAIISIIGAVFIAQPTFLFPAEIADNVNVLGVIYALISALLRAISIVALRKVGKDTFPFLNVLYYAICGSITTTFILLIIREFEFPCAGDLPFLFSLGCIGVIGQFCFTLAARYERAGTVSVLKSTQIIFVYILQITVLDDIPTLYSFLGAALILSSSIGIGVRKIVNETRRKKSI